MKSSPECIPCYLKQTISVVKRITNDEKVIFQILNKAIDYLKLTNPELPPAENTYIILKSIQEIIKNEDPFKQEKQKHNNIALNLYPYLKKLVKESKDQLFTALKVSAAGNIIDVGILESFDIHANLKEVMEKEFKINHYDLFKEKLKYAKNILFIFDNAGEIVFDMVLIEELLKYCNSITGVVNAAPNLNDATYVDAEFVGLTNLIEIITSGNDRIGKSLQYASDEYKSAFSATDVVISKGQANYEVLNELNKEIFFILKAKCPIIAKELKVETNDTVLVKTQT